jgi:hypothetical protein
VFQGGRAIAAAETALAAGVVIGHNVFQPLNEVLVLLLVALVS